MNQASLACLTLNDGIDPQSRIKNRVELLFREIGYLQRLLSVQKSVERLELG